MMFNKPMVTFLSTALLAGATATCMAADMPSKAWEGTWKLNAGKSKMTGATQKVNVAADGKWTVMAGGVTLNFACDGKAYPIFGGRELICNKRSDTQVETAVKAGNQELARDTRTLSDGGKTLTSVETIKNEDGTSFNVTEVLKKVSGGDSWSGVWRDTKVQVGDVGLMMVQCSGDMIKFSYPNSKSSVTAKLDGTPAQEQGPHPDGVDISLRSAGPTVIHEVDTLNGKPLEHDTLTVSADGKVMQVEVLRAGDDQKQVYVYDKQ